MGPGAPGAYVVGEAWSAVSGNIPRHQSRRFSLRGGNRSADDFGARLWEGAGWVSAERRTPVRKHPTCAGKRNLADTLAEREEDIQQVIGGIKGFKAYYLLKIAEGTTTISIFENQEGAEESNRAAAAWLAENLPDLDVAAPYVTAGEVLIGF